MESRKGKEDCREGHAFVVEKRLETFFDMGIRKLLRELSDRSVLGELHNVPVGKH